MKTSSQSIIIPSFQVVFTFFSLTNLLLIVDEECMKKQGDIASSSSSHPIECYDLPLAKPEIRDDLAKMDVKESVEVKFCKICGNRIDVTQSFDEEGRKVLETIEHSRHPGEGKSEPNFVYETEFDWNSNSITGKLRFFDENGNKLPNKTKQTFMTKKAENVLKLSEMDEKLAEVLPIRVKKPNQLVTNLVDLDEKDNLVHKMTHKVKFNNPDDGQFKSKWEIHEDGKDIKFDKIENLHKYLDGMGEKGKEMKSLSKSMKENLLKRKATKTKKFDAVVGKSMESLLDQDLKEDQ